MTLPRTAAEVLSGHVRLEVRCIDRAMLTFRQPRLQYGQGIHGFFCHHRGNQFASSALMMPMTGRFAADIRLTEEQREKLQTALADGREKIGEYMKSHPNTTRAEIVAKVKENRGQIHDRLAKVLDSEQLVKWDNEVAKAKEFLGQKLDS